MTLLAMKMKNNSPKKKLVFGLGQTGYSCVSYLVRQGFEVIVFDTRQNPPCLEKVYTQFPQVEVFLGKFDAKLLEQVSQVIASPGIALQSAELKAARNLNIEIIGDVQLFAQYAKAPLIAITGSNGKSTTTCMVAEMFQKAGKNIKMGGNIGVPVLDLLEEEVPDYYILELSSFQLETTPNLNTLISVVLNVSEDHMDRYESFDEYGQSKLAIYNNAQHKLFNLDDQWLSHNKQKIGSYVGFTSKKPSSNEYGIQEINGKEWITFGDELLFDASKLKIAGRHQILNAVVAIAIGDICELSREKMCAALAEFEGLAHRTQVVTEIDRVTYINDSKGTNVGATIAAVDGLNGPVVLIAGGEGKGADFSELRDALSGKVRQAILIGRDAGLIEAVIKDFIPVIRAVSLSAAVKQAAKIAEPGDFVLLSPACASFDMFDNYQQRGEAFMNAVKELK